MTDDSLEQDAIRVAFTFVVTLAIDRGFFGMARSKLVFRFLARRVLAAALERHL